MLPSMLSSSSVRGNCACALVAMAAMHSMGAQAEAGALRARVGRTLLCGIGSQGLTATDMERTALEIKRLQEECGVLPACSSPYGPHFPSAGHVTGPGGQCDSSGAHLSTSVCSCCRHSTCCAAGKAVSVLRV